MKKFYFIILTLGIFSLHGFSQSSDDILNVLVQKNLIEQKEADSIRAEAAIAAQASLAKVKAFPVNASKKISLAGYTQVRYQMLEQAGAIDGFDIRRARVDLKGSFSPYWGYRVQFDLAGTPKLIDAFVELKLNEYLNFTVGQAKIPFSLENLASSTRLELIDRSQVVEALTARGRDVGGNQNGRDIGIQVGGTIVKLKDKPFVDYRLGVFNGSGINTNDKDNEKDYATRLIFYPTSGLAVSGAWYDGSRFIPESTAGGVTTPARSVHRDRLGFDLSYDLKNFSLRSEYIYGKDHLTEREGYYLLGGYYLNNRKIQLVAKYDFYDPNRANRDDASTWVVLGGNYNFNANTKLQLNYSIKQEEGTSVDNNFANVQLQIGF